MSRSRTHPALVVPLGIFAASRVFSTMVLLLGSSRQVTLEPSPAAHVERTVPAHPGYWGLVTNWDGQWYQTIALHGYPRRLPSGGVSQTAWAFYPGYPALVRAVMETTGAGFAVAATVVSVTAAAAAMCLLYQLLVRHGNRFVAGATVACLSTYVTASLWQVAYGESLALLLLVGALSALSRRRLGLVLLCGLCLALTRPIVAPLALVVLVELAWRWRGRRRTPVQGREALAQLGVALTLAASTLLWPFAAALVTGRASTYADTMAAWPTFRGGPLHGGALGALAADGDLPSAAVLIALLLALVALVLRPQAAMWGVGLRTWALAYPFFIVLVNGPSPSMVRYAMLAIAPLFPLPDPGSSPSDPHGRRPWRGEARLRWGLLIVLILLGLVCQYLWTVNVFVVHAPGALQPYP
jgi:hypothetical protein